MSTETQTTETSTPATQTKELSDPSLSFAEYQTLRRGGAVTSSAPESAPAAKTAEQKPSEKSGISETDPEEADESKASTESEHDSEAKDDSTEDQKPKKKGGFQRRIDKLNAATAAARQEAEFWKQQALKHAGATKTETPEKVETTAKTPEATGKPDPNVFETHADYVEALTEWKLEQREKESKAKARAEELQNQQNAALKAHSDRVKAFAEKTEDFHESIAELDDIPMSPSVAEALVSSEHGPALMYELAKNRDEFARICNLSPLAAAREIGKIESKIASSMDAKTETKKTTQAPKPLAPVGKTASGPSKSIDDPNLSFTEYERLRREQMKRRRA
jgi:hypothetical protein